VRGNIKILILLIVLLIIIVILKKRRLRVLKSENYKDNLAHAIYLNRLSNNGLGRLKMNGKRDSITDYLIAECILYNKPYLTTDKEFITGG